MPRGDARGHDAGSSSAKLANRGDGEGNGGKSSNNCSGWDMSETGEKEICLSSVIPQQLRIALPLHYPSGALGGRWC
jgi:hypothetical protein